MDAELRTRVIVSLRWLVEDAKVRFDGCRDAMGTGLKGGYSPELTDAINLLDELTAGLFLPAPGQIETTGYVYSEQQCKDTAVMVGGTEADGTAFYLQYAPQGFLWGNGLPITDLKIALRKWILKTQERDGGVPEARKTCTGLTPREMDIQARGR